MHSLSGGVKMLDVVKWAIPGLITLTSISIIAALAYVAVWYSIKEKYLLLWSLGWAFFGTRYLFDMISFKIVTLWPQIFVDLMVVCSTSFFWAGFLLLIKSKNRYKKVVPRVLLSLAYILSVIFKFVWDKSNLASIPVYFSSGLLIVIIGWEFLRKKYDFHHYNATIPLGISMILWGVHRLNYPFLRYSSSFVPYGYFSGSILSACVAIFLLGLAIEKEKYQKDISIARYKKFFENSRDVMLLFNNEGIIIEVNKAAEKAYGYSKRELCGKHISYIEVVKNEDYYQEPKCMSLHESIHKRKDGRRFPVELSSQVIKIGDEEIYLAIIRDITERKEYEERLKRSQEFYLYLFDQVPMAMWRAGINGQFNYFNRRWLSFTGKTSEEEIGLEWTKGIHPDDRDLFMQSYIRAIMSKEPFEATYRFRRFDGEFRWIINVGYPFIDLDNRYAGYIGTCFDVTDERVSQERIRELQESLSITLRSIDDAVIATDITGEIRIMNLAAEKLIGIKEEEAIKRHFSEVVHLYLADNTECSKEFLEWIRQDQKVDQREFYLRKKDGTFCSVSHSSNTIKKEDGSVEGIVIVLRDITKEREAQLELQSSEMKYRTTFENIGTGLLIAREDMIIELVNREMEKLTGYKKEELERKMSWHQFVSLKDLNRMKEYNKQRFSRTGSPPKVYEFTLVDRHGVEHNVLCNVELLPSEKQIVASWVDITERKKAEEKIRYLSYHDHLTGLYNRAKCEEEMAKLDKVENLPLSVIMGDVNGLKLVNDAFGHERGDKLLINIARILSENTRDTDIVARWGGDEFIILLPKTTKEEAQIVLDTIRETCATTEHEYNLNVQVSISLGVGTKTEPTQDIKEVIIRAESDMYSQKIQESHEFKAKVFASLEERLLEKNKETREHVLRVKKISERIGKAIGLTQSQLEELTMAAALHDIGKVGVDESLWTRAEGLTQEELEKLKQHPIIGYHIIKTYPQLSGVAEAVLSHHERWDGKGFPQGLKKTEIPIMARIIAIADAFDALTSHGNTSSPALVDKALEELEENKGTEFDPELIEAFIKTYRQ